MRNLQLSQNGLILYYTCYFCVSLNNVPWVYGGQNSLSITTIRFDLHSAPFNSIQKYAKSFGRIWLGVEFRVAFNIGSQWSVSRRSGRIGRVDWITSGWINWCWLYLDPIFYPVKNQVIQRDPVTRMPFSRRPTSCLPVESQTLAIWPWYDLDLRQQVKPVKLMSRYQN